MGTENPVTPGKDSNYINYQQFMSGVFPGAYIRVGGWGTNLYHWYPPVVRARVKCMRLQYFCGPISSGRVDSGAF